MANLNLKNTPPVQKHHLRTAVSSLFGFMAIGLIIASIVVVWLDRTLTNTDQYVKTVTPLVSEPAVQDFVVSKASGAFIDSADAPVRDIANQLLGADIAAGKTDEQLRSLVRPLVNDSVRSVVAAPAFAALWRDSNKAIHSQLISQLANNSPSISLNFHPLISGVIDQLGATKLGFVKDKIALKDDVGIVTLEGEQLSNVHKGYDYFKKGMLIVLGAAVIATLLCVLISVHHLKTLRRIAVLTGLYAAFLAVVLSAGSLIKATGSDAVQQNMAVALVDGITRDLRLSLIIVAVICLGAAVGSKLYAVIKARNASK